MEIDYDFACFVVEMSTVCRSDAYQLIIKSLNCSAYEF